MKSKKIGVVGLGLMGTAITERLLEAGYALVVYNRSKEKAAPLVEKGATWSDNPFLECDQVIVSLYTSEVVEEVLGKFDATLRPGHIIMDTTTGDPEQGPARGRRLAERGVAYLETPISGNSDQTRRGEVMIIVSGDQVAFEACKDVLLAVTDKVPHVGPLGNATKMKLVTNLVLGLNRAVVAEALGFAKAIGLTYEDALEVLRGSVAYSGVMETKGQKMITGEFSPVAKLSQHLKDVRLMLLEGRRGGAKLPFSELHDKLLAQLEAEGYGEEDNCAIIRAFQ